MNKGKFISLIVIVLLAPFLGMLLSYILIPPMAKLVGVGPSDNFFITLFSIISIYVCVFLVFHYNERV